MMSRDGYSSTGRGLIAAIGDSPRYTDADHMRLCIETFPVIVGRGHPYGETRWPVWLSPLAFADWAARQDELPPDDVLRRVGLIGGDE